MASIATATRSAQTPTQNPGHVIDHDRWENELAKAEVSKSDLNLLLLDYLLIEGFADAAAEFARETGISANIDHEMIHERMEIKEAVIEGRVEEAVRRVNELDPEILDTNAPLLFHLHLLHLIELIRIADLDAALQFATKELAPRGAQNPEFLIDLERTMALLAFPDLVKFADDASDPSSVSEYTPDPTTQNLLDDPAFVPILQLMRRSQRVKVAKELNAAILESQSQGVETKLSSLVRLMAWGEERSEKAGLVLPVSEASRGREWVDKVLGGDGSL